MYNYVAISFLLGLILGAALRNYAWASKATGPSRMLYRGKFYNISKEPSDAI